ncbi:MAG: STAS domain-containing protein [Bacteroidetes bacterium]|nr:STAS domain-containing protein [Bacteroidota bacterium]
MEFKIDTKEKFRVISLLETNLTANMTDALRKLLSESPADQPPHLVLKMGAVKSISAEAASCILDVQQQFYDRGHSMVICELGNNVEQLLDEIEILDLLNATPTESEAWDIVQMEEIERELLGDEDSDHPTT